MDAKTIGLGVGAGIIGLGLTGLMKRSKPSLDAKLDRRRFAFLDEAEEVALHADATLEDICERLQVYAKYDEEVYEEFVRTAAACAEFLIRKDEVRKRSVPLMFRGFSTTLIHRVRELRRAIRDQDPHLLQEFDEIAAEVTSFQTDQHHNLWCEAAE